MSEPFGSVYAECYDAIYQEKNYQAECDMIERLFKRYGDGQIKTVLDLGCGTGNHALPLSLRGFEVIGVDRSESMLAQARKKAAQSSLSERDTFYQADIRSVDLGRQFDATLLMFSVLGYQLDNAVVTATLRTARRHLRSGGLLLFDVWYGPSVLFLRPSEREKTIPVSNGKILRVSSSELDASRHTCTVRYHLRKFDTEGLVSEAQEEHTVRYFLRLSLIYFWDLRALVSLVLEHSLTSNAIPTKEAGTCSVSHEQNRNDEVGTGRAGTVGVRIKSRLFVPVSVQSFRRIIAVS